MTATLTAEAIIFSIHSAIKLSSAFQKAYANSLRGKNIVLPLPKINTEPNLMVAVDFFDLKPNRELFVDKLERLAQLHTKAGTASLDHHEETEYLVYYKNCFCTVNEVTDLKPEDMAGLLRIRQWEEGKAPITKPLQLVAGSLVEVGIDYFSQVPGAIRSESGYAKFLKSFLNGIDDIPFATEDSFSRIIKKVVPQLFVSTAETLEYVSTEITGDEKLQQFIQATSRGITNDLYQRIDAMSTAEDDSEVIGWGQMLFRSLIKNSGTYVFNAPGQVVNVGESQEKLIQAVGTNLMSALLDPDPTGMSLKNVFTVETLDSVVKSSLEIVAQYPSLVSGQEGIKAIISGIASSVASSGINRPGLVPDLARLVLQNTAQHLDLVVGVETPGAKHLLVTAVSQTLFSLSETTDPGKWRPKLTNSQLIGIAEYTLNEVVVNPAWIEEKVNEDSILAEVLNSTFNALGAIPEGQRLNYDTLHKLVQLNLRTVATSKAVLNKVKLGTEQEETTILNKAMDLVLSFVYKDVSQQVGNKTAYLFNTMDFVMETIISHHPNPKGLVLTRMFLNANAGIILESGINKDYANHLLDATLEIVSTHPDLLVNDLALQNIIGGVAASFHQSGIKQSGLLSEFIRITLVNVSGNLDLMLTNDAGEKNHILVAALQQTLNVLTLPPASGKWKPQLSGYEVLTITENILNEVVKNPGWVSDKVNDSSLLQEVLNATFQTLENIPHGQRVDFETLDTVIEINMRTVSHNKLVLKQSDETKKSILSQSLTLVFDAVFNVPSSVDKSDLLIETLDFALDSVVSRHPDNKGIAVLGALLHKELGIIASTGIQKDQATQFVASAFRALSAHPDLVSSQTGIQNIVSGVSAALADNGIKEPGIAGEFVRLTLDLTAVNMNLLVTPSDDSATNILVVGIEQFLKAIAKPPSSGKWKPSLTGHQTLDLTQDILEQVVDNPQWVDNDLIQIVTTSVFQSLETVPRGRPLHYSTIQFLVRNSIKAVNARKQLVVKVISADGGVQQLALDYSLNGLFVALYDESGGTTGTWTLTQTETLNAIIEHYLGFISEQPVTKDQIDISTGKIKKAVADLNNDLQFNTQDFLSSLQHG